MTACPCGYSFPNSLGKHGCPNCHGESLSATARQARSRKSRAEAGGKQIAVMLTPAAAAKLAAYVAKGESITSVVNRLLCESKAH